MDQPDGLQQAFGEKLLTGFFDANGVLTWANTPFRDRIGVGQDGRMNFSQEGFFSLDDGERMLRTIKDCLNQRDIYVRIETRSGTNGDRFYRWEFKTLCDHEGKVIGVHCNGYDITALKEEKAKLLISDTLTNHVSDAVITTDTHFKIVAWNSVAEEHYEISASEAIGRHFNEIIHYNQPTEEYEAMRHALMNQGAWEGTVTYFRKDGSEQFVWIRSTLLRDENGDPLGFVGIGRDVTEKKKAERERLISSVILQNTIDAVYATDLKHRITLWNQTAERMYGIGPEQALGRHPYDLLPFQLLDEGTDTGTVIKSIEEKGSWSGKFFMTRADGNRLCLSADIQKLIDGDGAHIGYFTAVRDITDLHESQQLLERTFNSGFEGMMVLDHDLRILKMNDRAVHITGMQRDEWVGKNAMESRLLELNPDLQQTLELQFRWAFEGRKIQETATYLNYDGSTRMVNYSIRPIMEQNGAVHLLIIELEDVTDVFQARSENRKTERLLSSYMQHSPVPAWITDRQGRMYSMNERFMEFFHLTPDMIGRRFEELVRSPYVKQYAMHNRQVLESGKALQVLEFGMDRDGRTHSFLNNKFPITLEDGTVLVGGIGLDITDLLQAEAEKKMASDNMAALTKAIHDVIWEWDVVNDGFKWSNSGGAAWEQSVDGRQKKLSEVMMDLHPDDRDMIHRSLQRAIRNKNKDNWQAEYRVVGEKGHVLHFLDRAVILRDPDGNAIRMIGVMQDITDRVTLEAELREQQEREHRNVTRMIFEAQESERNRIANDLHDNVNPLLAAARLYINSVETHLTDPDHNQALVHSKALILEGIDEIRKISHNLSNTLIHEHGLEDVVRNVIRKMNPDEKIKVTLELSRIAKASPHPHIKTNLVRIIQEQFNNINKYAKAEQVDIRLGFRDGRISLSIKDDGVGFDPERTRNGIGLLNIRNRVESYDGKMKLTSAPGKGCLLEVQLPADSGGKRK